MEHDTNFPWKTTQIFHGERHKFFMEKRGMCLQFSCAGVNIPVSYRRPPRGPDQAAARLERPDPCGTERSFLTSTGHTQRAEYQPATVMMAPAWSHDVQPAQRAYRQIGRPEWGAVCEGVGGSRVGRCRPAGPSRHYQQV